MLEGIDISEFQAPEAMKANQLFKDAKFVIVRASYGLSRDKHAATHAKQVIDAGKLLGFYHYAYPKYNPNPETEVDNFITCIKPYIGKALLALDWEGESLDYSADWAYQFLNKLRKKTGVVPLIYLQASHAKLAKYQKIADEFALWLAQYNSYSEPGIWKKYTIWQYSDKPLDKDKFTGDAKTWGQWAAIKNGSSAAAPVSPAAPTAKEKLEQADKLIHEALSELGKS